MSEFKNIKMDLSPHGISRMIYLNADALDGDIEYILPKLKGKKEADNFFEAEIRGTIDLWNQVKDSDEFKKGIGDENYSALKNLMETKFVDCSKIIRESI